MEKTMKPETAEKLIASVINLERLKKLSNTELVREAMHCEAADWDVVLEMMERLAPGWADQDCGCEKCWPEIRPSALLSDPLAPEHGYPATHREPESGETPSESVG